jgi:long-chain acyl-CoA synthetase
VLRDGAVFDAEAIREWTRGHLTAYKVPKTIVPFDTLPRSLVGKVQRREVREELLRRRAR